MDRRALAASWVRWGAGVGAVGVAWLLLYGWLLLVVTDGLLVPWDISIVEPPIGTWERAVDDFFEGPPGRFLPAVLVVGCSVVLLLLGLRRQPKRARLLGAFALSNVAFVLADGLLLLSGFTRLPIFWLPPADPSWDPGFNVTWFGILLTVILLLGLLAGQARWALGAPADRAGLARMDGMDRP